MEDLLFDRKIGLVVYNSPTYSNASSASAATGSTLQQTAATGTATPGSGLDLSQMRIRFRTSQSDVETPNTAIIRVYNLSDQTAKAVAGEFTRVTLQAGYKNGPYGVIFDGTIKQVMRGHETNIDSYVDIFAADGDVAYNNACVSTSLAAGSTSADRLNAILQATQPYGVSQSYATDLPPTALSRGKVMFGLARDQARGLAKTANHSWSIQNGQMTFISLTGYRPGEAVVLNSNTGLIGFPEQTPGGIEVRALLNPKIQIGTLVQIDNKAINQGFAASSGPLLFEQTGRLESLPGYLAKISDDGFYKVLVHEFSGDTRGNEWYSRLVCLAVDRSAPSGQQVAPYWAGGPRD